MENYVGRELATNVANNLLQGHVLAYHHPYYCGTGLVCIEGAYIHCQMGDWALPTKAEAIKLQALKKQECLVFESHESFIAWLEQQTDESLLGPNRDNNQRVTINRLKRFVESPSEQS